MNAPQVLQIARGEVGYTECQGHRHAAQNHTKYGLWYGMDGVAWCAIFLSWVFNKAGMPEYRGHYTPGWANWFAYRGWFYRNPVVGDLAFFDFPGDSKERIQHVGIVEAFSGNYVTCIEGNTSSGPTGSQDNGGGVYRRTRPRSYVVGYGRPAYLVREEEDLTTLKARLIRLPDQRIFAVPQGGVIAKPIATGEDLQALIASGIVEPLDEVQDIDWHSAVWLDIPDK